MCVSRLLDIVETNIETKKGIVDFVSTKHIIFYDLSDNNDPKLTALIIIWRTYFSDTRFSIFVSLYGGDISIPSPILISKKGINDTNHSLTPNKPKRKKVRRLKKNSPLNSIMVFN